MGPGAPLAPSPGLRGESVTRLWGLTAHPLFPRVMKTTQRGARSQETSRPPVTPPPGTGARIRSLRPDVGLKTSSPTRLLDPSSDDVHECCPCPSVFYTHVCISEQHVHLRVYTNGPTSLLHSHSPPSFR